MHGAHPSHLAFKLSSTSSFSFSVFLAFVLSLSLSLSPWPCVPFSLSRTFQRTRAAPGAFPSSSARERPAVSVSVHPGLREFPGYVTGSHVSPRSTPRSISLFFIPPRGTLIRTRTCFRTLENAAVGGGMTGVTRSRANIFGGNSEILQIPSLLSLATVYLAP